ncbi:RNA 2',3'-cyclic phosphodiesterase [Bacillus suaedaesalsae]|uniref:RNA 2',3'-cyclic phosphodiesterase n=1 Tax=Bacillus suaedaesalsae TaxID=2810349 RepID=A0ABS2DD54_9BACI|nr:RNA 2',3'-cyclic phosphodiesterase [Bacillus suaedaesalsae]MBM6616387.1 RNA 2',3'-cyclic phosphodiesterase [Bacillus suaedaesalsae]
MTKTHYFLAIPIPIEIKQAFKQWREENKIHFPFKSWVHHEDYHITLVFLGDAPEAELEKVKKEIREIVQSHEPFELTLNGLGYFGQKESPRIFWGGIKRQVQLENLQRDVFEACGRIGFELEKRPYRPHLTLARRYKEGNGFPFEQLNHYFQIDPSLRAYTVQSVVLYQTHLDRVPKYEAIETFDLGVKR